MEYCKYCGKEYKNKNSKSHHEKYCVKNPNRLIHTKSYYTNNIKVKGEEVKITKEKLDIYLQTHLTCEICGKTIEEVNKWNSKFAPKRLCIDHDHTNGKFRGLLCHLCNRQLGWYEKYKKEIDDYLKNDSDMNEI